MRQADETTAGGHLTFTGWIAGVSARWRLIALTTVGAVALALAATFIIPPVYRSNASFVANSAGGSKLPGGLGGSSALGGIISQFGGSMGGDPSESPVFYVQLLASRKLLTRLLDTRFPDPRTVAASDSAPLISILRIRNADPQRRVELAVKQLSDAVSPGWDAKTNLVWFSVDAQWPELSAQIANEMVGQVGSFNREIRVSRSKSKRAFLQMRRDSAQDALRSAEERQRFFYEQNRGFVSAPSLKFEEQRIRRDVELASDLYVNLDRQLEGARIDEINDAALITVVDTAVAPRKAQWPRYGVLVFSAAALGLLAGLVVAGSAAILADWRRRNPNTWADLRGALRPARPGAVPETREEQPGAPAQQPAFYMGSHANSSALSAVGRSEEPLSPAQRPAV
ncbi:MAG: GNVR domain-containing protein [Gemmatimonadaceae bacterium]